jgi:5-methyltetrahydrofolate--homocysteine methyltransferase
MPSFTRRSQGYLDAARERVMIQDGSMGVSLQQRNLTADDFGGPQYEGCPDYLVFTRPDVIADLHRSFLAVGVDVILTDSFGGLPATLGEYGLADRAEELNRTAASLAREVVSGSEAWVAGSVGPGTRFPSLGNIGFDELRDGYEVQCRGLLLGGVDALVIETVFDLLQGKAALIGARRAMASVGRDVPVHIQATFERGGRMLPGTDIGAALTAFEALRPDVVGLNCSTGPAEMQEQLRYLGQQCPVPVACSPNAGLPSVVDGKMVYDLSPEDLAVYHERFILEFGVSVVGGCCGTTPAHLEAVVERCKDLVPARRSPQLQPAASSIYTAVPFRQDTSFLVVGERTNANGSRKFRDLMLAGDWETCVDMCTDQVKEGAHVVDVCVDYTGEDGVANMTEVARRFATQSSVPLMLDSTEPEVIEAGLRWIGAKPILNSVNLEDGDAEGTRLDRFFRLAREYGAAVVCTCIDEVGQARTAEWKLRAAAAIHKVAVERYGMHPTDLIFDPLALPLSTGMEESRRDGIETLEAITLIKDSLPGVSTILGLSNISFGLNPAARQALNSVFLHEAVRAGLDAAIVHASKIVPLSQIDERARQVCLDLVYDRRGDDYDPLEVLLDLFEGATVASGGAEEHPDWPVDRRLEQRIVDGALKGLSDDLEEALGSGMEALGIVNDVLLAGMKTVGGLFASGEMQLPFVLKSAEVMKAAVAYLEPHMPKASQRGKGRIVLATVKGDVHDIGKNLVDIILTNNGYEVFNLGTKVPIAEMLDTAQRVEADAIGMSGLLVKSTLIMRENLEELNERKLSGYPVLLGGAALTRRYVERDLREVYEGRLFYGKDAFEGLHVMDRLMDIKERRVDDPTWGTEPSDRPAFGDRAQASVGAPSGSGRTERSPDVATDNEVFKPPFLGARVVSNIPVDEIAAYLNETALFRNQWQYRPVKGENDADFKSRIRPELKALLHEAKTQQILQPQVAYGYFSVNGEGNDLVVWTDDSATEELARFAFPRQSDAPYLCISDFFRPADTGERDYAAFAIATMGSRVSAEAAELFAANHYTEYLKLHGLGVEMAEALAEYWHWRIRDEWGFAEEDGPSLTGLFRQQYRGGRYSWGYPACPDLRDNKKVADVLGAEQLGIEISEETGWQYQPEQTTSAIICHHPKAKYFIAR